MQISSLPSNKKFGALFAVIFFLFSIYGYLKYGLSITAIFYFSISVYFTIAAILDSKTLTPLNRMWFLLGQALSKIVSPIVLGVIFFLLITPIGLISRLLGRDELKLHRQASSSYWVAPIASNSNSESFRNQF